MVNYTDKEGAYRFNVGRYDISRNPKLYRSTARFLPVFLLVPLFPRLGYSIKTGVKNSSYWKKRREQKNLEKYNFDLTIQVLAVEHNSEIKTLSAF